MNKKIGQSYSRIQMLKAKNYIMYKRKNLGKLTNLKLSRRIFVSESMSHENQQLAYKFRQLKSARKIPRSLTIL